jgi:DNA-binding transcriptional regulator YdaS (Cro superfamily)
MTPYEALTKAVDVLGGQTALARVCGGRVKQQHVYNWLNRDKRLPDRYAMKVQQATSNKGHTVPVWDLCPDTFSSEFMDSIYQKVG